MNEHLTIYVHLYSNYVAITADPGRLNIPYLEELAEMQNVTVTFNGIYMELTGNKEQLYTFLYEMTVDIAELGMDSNDIDIQIL